MTRAKSKKCLGLCALGLAACACALPSAADEPVTSPYATGGEVTRIDRGNLRATYIHVFTNTDEAATFASTGKRDLKVRYLVVGAGGAGGTKGSSSFGGGGGGGGGVCEEDNVLFGVNSVWHVLVGKGSTKSSTVAGASSISNGVAEVETVPGGGNGAGGNDYAPTIGAAGGGGQRNNSGSEGAAGNYKSSIFGEVPAGAPFAGGKVSTTRFGGAGGGAGGAGTADGGRGRGLMSDITGELLVYGAGGGGGCGQNIGNKNYYNGGHGGDAERAGCGGMFTEGEEYAVYSSDTQPTDVLPATFPAANSGCGGGGAAAWGETERTGGADGIVVIRYDVTEAPCEGGDVITKALKHGTTYTYIHTFTNTDEAAQFVNVSGRDIKNLRYLVVGAGGAGGSRYTHSGYAGGGGGGGGVCERKLDLLAADTAWQILVGKGAASYSKTAGASSISNGVDNVETVPGGGNGGSDVNAATDGAGGGGYIRNQDGYTAAGKGTYASSIFGVIPTGAPFAGNKGSSTRRGGGGGGAGAAASAGAGGEGLTSNITGEALVYGSGGGGGGATGNGTTVYNGGVGGTRAGNGGLYVDGEWVAATPAEANSGCGGGGAIGHKEDGKNAATGGADGIVVIRYDYNENPQGLMLIFR